MVGNLKTKQNEKKTTTTTAKNKAMTTAIETDKVNRLLKLC